MTAPQSETVTRDRYLAEAHAELDAMLGEVSTLDAPPQAERSWVRLLILAAVAVVVFAIGVLLLRGRRPAGMAMNAMP